MDIDGVITLFYEFVTKVGSETFHKNMVNPSAYEIEDMFDVDKEAVKNFWQQYSHFYDTECPARDYIYEFSKEMYKRGHKIILITNMLRGNKTSERKAELIRYTENYIKKHLYKYESIQYSMNNKLELAKQLNIDCMIEDCVQFVNEISTYCPVYYPVYPYNKQLGTKENIIPFHSFLELESIIEDK